MTEEASRPGRPSGDDGRAVRTQLLEAAKELFAELGFRGVSLRRVAKAAGATPAMIHYYFGDKHGLFRALIVEMFEPRLTSLESRASEHRISLEQFVSTYIAMFRAHPWIPRLVFREVLQGEEGFRRQFAKRMAGRILPILTAALEEEKAAGRIREDVDPVAVVITVMSLCVYPFLATPIIEAGLGRPVDDEFAELWRDHVVRLLYQGLGP